MVGSQTRHKGGQRNITGQGRAIQSTHNEAGSEVVMENRHIIEGQRRCRTAKASAEGNGLSPAETVADESEQEIPDNVGQKDRTQQAQPLRHREANLMDEEGREKDEETKLGCGVDHPDETGYPGLGTTP